MCGDVKTFILKTYETLGHGEAHGPCGTNFLLISPLMVVVSAVRLVANLLFALLTALGALLCYLLCCQSTKTLQCKASLALQNAGYSLCHIFFSIFNTISFGTLSILTPLGSNFIDNEVESAFFGMVSRYE